MGSVLFPNRRLCTKISLDTMGMQFTMQCRPLHTRPSPRNHLWGGSRPMLRAASQLRSPHSESAGHSQGSVELPQYQSTTAAYSPCGPAPCPDCTDWPPGTFYGSIHIPWAQPFCKRVRQASSFLTEFSAATSTGCWSLAFAAAQESF